MSLQTKFLLLIGTLGLAVVGSLGAAWWAFGVLHRELVNPVTSVSTVLDGLSHIKRATTKQVEVLSGTGRAHDGEPPPATADTPGDSRTDRFREAGATIDHWLGLLERDAWTHARLGPSTLRNLKLGLREAQDAGERSLIISDEAAALVRAGDQDESAGAQKAADAAQSHSLNKLRELHDLIEKTESHILVDATEAILYGQIVQQRLLIWLLSVLAAAALASVLAVILLRRWVQRPVASLRQAAARIAQGDFQHRVPVVGRDELSSLSAEVNHMATMIHVMQEERAERERLAAIGGMVRRLVHNLRNPLSGIRSLAEVTRMDLKPGSENRQSLDLIVSTVDTFERWLNDLLDSTSPTWIATHRRQVRPWLADVVDSHRPMAQSRSVRLVLDAADAPETAVFDAAHMDQAMAAILSNAIEVSPPNSSVRVRACASADGQAWEVQVTDQGPGVPQELRSRIFEPHFTTKHQGHGIGLAFAQQVVRAHGGRLSVDDAAPGDGNRYGACFVVRIPFGNGQAGRTPVADDSHQPG